MKNLLLILIITFTSKFYSQTKYVSEETNDRIIEILKSKKTPETFNPNALFVIDGKPILEENLNVYMKLIPENIVEVNAIEESSGTGAVIWGEKAKDGVVMIKTNLVQYPEFAAADKSSILFILDNKIITKQQAYAIDAQKDIESVVVYKNANKFKLFSGEEYDGILVFTSKVR